MLKAEAYPEPEPTFWEVGERHVGWRLDRFLLERLPRFSRSRIQGIIGERISLSWRASVAPGTRLVAGGRVIAGFPELGELRKSVNIPILHEDADLLAVDKPAGLIVHPSNAVRALSLIEILRRDREEPELRLIHRLDRETSGVLLLARSAEAARVWGRALMRGAFRKIYAARVLGRPPSPEGTVDQPIGREPGRRVFVRRKVMEGGEKAVTHYRLLRDDGDTCVLEFRPLTGRCHQLRVHAEWLGCPIVGDPLYGKPDYAYIEYAAQVRGRERLYLHAWKIEGEIAGRSVAIEAPLPEIFSRRELAWPPIRRPEF